MLAYVEVTDDELDLVLADQMLEGWYHISKKYRPNLGFPRIAPYCRQFKSTRQYDDPTMLTQSAISRAQYVLIDLCVDKLRLAERAAISIEMKNRQVKRKVWRCALASDYQNALAQLMPLMRVKGLFY